MRVTLAVLADGVNVTVDAKLNLLGVFDQVRWTPPQTLVPMMYAVFLVEPEEGEYETEHDFHLSLDNPEGEEILRTPAAHTVVPPRPAIGRIRMNQIAGFGGIQFPHPGVYHVTLHMDDDHFVHSIELPVVPL